MFRKMFFRQTSWVGVLLLATLGILSTREQAWAGLSNRPPASDLTISLVKVIQGTSLSEDYQVSIANRATTARAFISSSDGGQVNGVTGRMCALDRALEPLGCVSAANEPITVPSLEGDLDSTLNFSLPASWLKPGYAYHIDLDPDNLIEETDEANNRYPSSGEAPFNFSLAPPLRVMVVPIAYKPLKAAPPLSPAAGVIPPQTQHVFLPISFKGHFFEPGFYVPQTYDLSYLTFLAIKLLPVPSADFQTHAYYIYSPGELKYNLDKPDGWLHLLSDLIAVHNMEDPAGEKNYYGLVNSFDAHGCASGCINGVGHLGGEGGDQTAVGWSGLGAASPLASTTMIHELGHNFNRRHAICESEEENPDLDYPYQEGKIGVFGLDVAEGVLYNPSANYDYMSYCKPVWTSDYTYSNVYQFRQALALQASRRGVLQKAIYLSGYFSPNGQATLRPVYRQLAEVTQLAGGAYTIELRNENGGLLATYPFSASEVADAPGFHSFGFFAPDVDGLGGVRLKSGKQVLAETKMESEMAVEGFQNNPLLLDQAQGGMILRWTPAIQPGEQVVHRLRFSQDGGGSWQVLALDWPTASFTIPAEFGLQLEGAWLEIQASDGVHTSTRVDRLKP